MDDTKFPLETLNALTKAKKAHVFDTEGWFGIY